jgi:hypothetical protein
MTLSTDPDFCRLLTESYKRLLGKLLVPAGMECRLVVS